MQFSPAECAREVLEVVPLVMRRIRAELRRRSGGDLSVPQLRTLIFLSRNEGTSLSQVAEHVGLTLPSMSSIIDGLVARRLATRGTHPNDRRRMTLALTTRGQTTLRSALRATEAYLRDVFATLPPAERAIVVQSMRTLRPAFSQGRIGITETEVAR
jgi:DNA-binding MarR family transcriptional regulator